MTSSQTQVEYNKALVRPYYAEVANTTAPDTAIAGAERLLTSDFTFYTLNDAEGQSGLDVHKGFLVWHHGVSPDQQWTIEDMLAEGDKVAVRFTICGTQQGEFHGVAPMGKPFILLGMDLFRIAESKIAELRRFFDLLVMLEQLGARSLPGRDQGELRDE